MVIKGKELFLTATEAARELNIARATFYRLYRRILPIYYIGRLKRAYYRSSEVKALDSVKMTVSTYENVLQQGKS